jgi:hypothetical protein
MKFFRIILMIFATSTINLFAGDVDVSIEYMEFALLDKYALFSTPAVVSKNNQLQSLVVFDLPSGFGASIWTSSDLVDGSGDEVDWNLTWGTSCGKTNISVEVGAWDINPVFSGVDDILTTAVRVSREVRLPFVGKAELYLKPRYYHTDPGFLGEGLEVVLGGNKDVDLSERVSARLGPFLAYNDGFGIKKGFAFGFDANLSCSVTERVSFFLRGKVITPLGVAENQTVESVGTGFSVSF